MPDQTTYTDRRLDCIAFPIGGIGTGCFSLSGRGALVDWEIFHRPNKLSLLPNTFFSIWTRASDGSTDARLLQSWPAPPYMGEIGGQNFYGFGYGVRRESGGGLRHLHRATFRGEYPFAWIEFEDPSLPVNVSLMAYNPFIPLNVEDSALPVGLFEITVTNPGSAPVDVSVAANLYNAIGYRGHGPFSYIEHGEMKGTGRQNVNCFVQSDETTAIFMKSEYYTDAVPYGGSMALATTWKDVTHQTAWLRGAWYDTLQAFWDEFSSTGRLQDRQYDEPTEPNVSDTGSLALHAQLAPGERAVMPVIISWYFPNFIKYWQDSYVPAEKPLTWRVPYAQRFADALDVTRYVVRNQTRLRQETEKFHQALFNSTLPGTVIDAISSQMSILKSPTVTLLEDGSFYGWEGVHTEAGSCEGSCDHVWNYALTHAYLFPSLQRSMRANDLRYNMFDDGRLCFRLQLPLGARPLNFHPAADGQMGGIMQLYRDWKFSGDMDWLRSLWPLARRALEYAWLYWDYNRDGVIEGLQHNTYDIEFYGPNSMMGSWYVGALRCAAEMAEALGEGDAAAEYARLAARGAAWMDANLFNGEYYEQHVDPEASRHSPIDTSASMGGQRADNPKYQYGSGCLSDQVIGAWMAHVCGIAPILDEQHVRQTLRSIFNYNFRPTLLTHNNAQRIYALGDEAGLLLCTWPRGGRPDLPFVYCDEVWSGIEYQVAGHLIYEGMVDEGLTIVKGLRARYDGERRNPWNEMECGSHYARSLASWTLLLALSGFSCDLTVGYIGFKPAISERPFRCFWSTGTGWGVHEHDADHITLRCDYGQQIVKTLRLGGAEIRSLTVNNTPVRAQFTSDSGDILIKLESPVTLRAGDELSAQSAR
ncbi:MAG TPA: GH116 family glycosyl-hydrolase [Aggregatilineales bacterium]|nr:GH116 family glycosyl-hydrolase [Aggregatilineales bacterium]